MEGDGGEVWTAVEEFNRLPQLIVTDGGVVVENEEVFGAGVFGTDVKAEDAKVAGELDEADIRGVGVEARGGIVGGGVVNNDDLGVVVGSAHGPDGSEEGVGAVVTEDDHGEPADRSRGSGRRSSGHEFCAGGAEHGEATRAGESACEGTGGSNGDSASRQACDVVAVIRDGDEASGGEPCFGSGAGGSDGNGGPQGEETFENCRQGGTGGGWRSGEVERLQGGVEFCPGR